MIEKILTHPDAKAAELEVPRDPHAKRRPGALFD
jgi:hypothetical protein